MALADKVAELQQTTAILNERLDSVRKSLDALENAHRELARELAELRRQSETASALHRRALEDFEKWKDDQKKEREERSRRWWSFGPNVLGALISGLIAAAVAYFVSRR